jgi:hypothetical protein
VPDGDRDRRVTRHHLADRVRHWERRAARGSTPGRTGRTDRLRFGTGRHLHFTPTSSSWLKLVECWFSVLSRKALTNTSFTSVAELETRIECWVSHSNDNPEPFVWTKPTDEILDKVARGQATLDRITKSATHHQ